MRVSIGKRSHFFIARLCCLFFFIAAQCQAGMTELHSQKELSRAVGLFRASRYVLYTESDDHYYYFQETGKFGWFGPSEKFKISKDLITIRQTGDHRVITYDQNRGLFFVRSGRDVEVIKANFVEQYTREEEGFLQAVEQLNRFSASDTSEDKIRALNRAMMASYFANHLKNAGDLLPENSTVLI